MRWLSTVCCSGTVYHDDWYQSNLHPAMPVASGIGTVPKKRACHRLIWYERNPLTRLSASLYSHIELINDADGARPYFKFVKPCYQQSFPRSSSTFISRIWFFTQHLQLHACQPTSAPRNEGPNRQEIPMATPKPCVTCSAQSHWRSSMRFVLHRVTSTPRTSQSLCVLWRGLGSMSHACSLTHARSQVDIPTIPELNSDTKPSTTMLLPLQSLSAIWCASYHFLTHILFLCEVFAEVWGDVKSKARPLLLARQVESRWFAPSKRTALLCDWLRYWEDAKWPAKWPTWYATGNFSTTEMILSPPSS